MASPAEDKDTRQHYFIVGVPTTQVARHPNVWYLGLAMEISGRGTGARLSRTRVTERMDFGATMFLVFRPPVTIFLCPQSSRGFFCDSPWQKS